MVVGAFARGATGVKLHGPDRSIDWTEVVMAFVGVLTET